MFDMSGGFGGGISLFRGVNQPPHQSDILCRSGYHGGNIFSWK